MSKTFKEPMYNRKLEQRLIRQPQKGRNSKEIAINNAQSRALLGKR